MNWGEFLARAFLLASHFKNFSTVMGGGGEQGEVNQLYLFHFIEKIFFSIPFLFQNAPVKNCCFPLVPGWFV